MHDRHLKQINLFPTHPEMDTYVQSLEFGFFVSVFFPCYEFILSHPGVVVNAGCILNLIFFQLLLLFLFFCSCCYIILSMTMMAVPLANNNCPQTPPQSLGFLFKLVNMDSFSWITPAPILANALCPL